MRFLLWLLLPVLLILYLFTFKRTFNLIDSYNRNLESFQNKALHGDAIFFLFSKVKAINTWKGQYMLDSTMTGKNVIATINLRCEELGLIFNEYRPLKASKDHIWTRLINVAGDFHSLLQLMYELEQIDKVCRVACVIFQKQKETGTTPASLSCTFYVQNLLNNK